MPSQESIDWVNAHTFGGKALEIRRRQNIESGKYDMGIKPRRPKLRTSQRVPSQPARPLLEHRAASSSSESPLRTALSVIRADATAPKGRSHGSHRSPRLQQHTSAHASLETPKTSVLKPAAWTIPAVRPDHLKGESATDPVSDDDLVIVMPLTDCTISQRFRKSLSSLDKADTPPSSPPIGLPADAEVAVAPPGEPEDEPSVPLSVANPATPTHAIIPTVLTATFEPAGPPRTNYHTVGCPTRVPTEGPINRVPKRTNLSAAPKVKFLICPRQGRIELKGKGSKHISVCAGPWASAFLQMPPLPATGAKRAAQGLSQVPLPASEIERVKLERSARCLTSILPYGSAGFLLDDNPAEILARPLDDTAERIVGVLITFGVASLDGAYSTLGRLLSWVIKHRPDVVELSGSHVADWCKAEPPNKATVNHLAWLRDRCGIDLPARGPSTRPYRNTPSRKQNPKYPLAFGALLALEQLAATHDSEFVRGHAAGFVFLARHFLRAEQASSCVINAIFARTWNGQTATIVSGSVVREKHPNPQKQHPRPFWGTFNSLVSAPGSLLVALATMLREAEGVKCIILDTDSGKGSPLDATEWILSPLKDSGRVAQSLQALLELAGMPRADTSRFLGHSLKRSCISVMEASPAFTPVQQNELARFSGSVAQNDDLMPVASMLQRHELRCAVLPAIYANKAKVEKILDLLVKLSAVMRYAALLVTADPSLLELDGGWDASGAIHRSYDSLPRAIRDSNSPPRIADGTAAALLLH